MEINIKEESKTKIIMEIKGEAHTFCNILVKELWNDEHTKVASYKIEHPLINIPTLILETDGKEEPRKVLIVAIKRLKKENEKFRNSFLKALKA